MWKDVIVLTDNQTRITARVDGDIPVNSEFSPQALKQALAEIGAEAFFCDEEAIRLFVQCVKRSDNKARKGVVIAEKKDASLSVELSEHNMLATMTVSGAYGGRGLEPQELVRALMEAGVVKGINKLALKKVLMKSRSLRGGEVFSQPVAQGKPADHGSNARFVPLVEDICARVLAPKINQEADKADIRDFGATITVGEGDEVMRRFPATKGTPGFTVTGEVLNPKPGTDAALVAGPGTHLSPDDPDLLLASVSGMPLIRSNTIQVESALCLSNVDVGSGHVKFKGSIVINGNVEPGMIVRATGSVTVGGFIESADVQAQGDIKVAKGIIGHTVIEDEERSCTVKSGGNIEANYAQYATLQAGGDIALHVHSISNDICCGHDLMVMDQAETQGSLSGGQARAGGRILCFNLGVEGDSATYVEALAGYAAQRERINQYKIQYKAAQENDMNASPTHGD